jgi:protein-disulfide isomerase
MKPSELLAEIDEIQKRPLRVRIYLILGFVAAAVVAVGARLVFSWAGKAGEQLASPAHPAEAPVPVVQAAAMSPAPRAPTPRQPHSDVVAIDVYGSPSRGPQDAPLTVVEFMDFEGPHCKEADETLRRLEEAFPGKIRRVYKAYPLGVHVHSRIAARAALVAQELDRFWPMHDGLFNGQDRLDEAAIEGIAGGVGIPRATFLTALARVDDARIDRDVRQGDALGLTGVPTVFINGHRIYGALPFEVFRKTAVLALAQRDRSQPK